MLTTYQRFMKEARAMIDDEHERCFYCLHLKSQHDGEPLPSGCTVCECYLFLSVSAWKEAGRRAANPTAP